MTSLNIAELPRLLDRNAEARVSLSSCYAASIASAVEERIEAMKEAERERLQGSVWESIIDNEASWNRIRRELIRESLSEARQAVRNLNWNRDHMQAELNGAMFYRFSA